MKIENSWSLELESMPHFDKSMERIYAWYESEVIDRPPVRFQAHNEALEIALDELKPLNPEEKKAWWFNVPRRIDLFNDYIDKKKFNGETFPMFDPNLGPDIYAAFYGSELVYGDITSWSIPLIEDWDDIEKLELDMENIYFKTIEELTYQALERAEGKYMVCYTDLHPGLDSVAAWRDPQQLCFDMIENPDKVKELAYIAEKDFKMIFNHFDKILKENNQLSNCWMGVPSFGKVHIPSEDFSSLISPKFFDEFGLPLLQEEVVGMTHNIYHMDGRGVKRHKDSILSVEGIDAVQWVQGMGNDYPIMQWVPFIKELQEMNMPVIVDLDKEDLDRFMDVMDPEGLFLWLATDNEEQEMDIMDRLLKWK